jgi:hypothetical protein
MNDAAPLAFRASAAQRAVTVSLALGCLLISVRGGHIAVESVPKVLGQLKLARSMGGEPTFFIWLGLVASLLALLAAGTVLVLSVLVLVLVEGTQVFVDADGIAVECPLLPAPLTRRLGAGRIRWENVRGVGRRKMRFVVTGDTDSNASKRGGSIGFLFVDELERLVFLIIDRSPNLKLGN